MHIFFPVSHRFSLSPPWWQTYACAHSPFSSYCLFPLVAGRNSPAKFIKDMKKTHPASMRPHAMAMEGTHSQRGHA